MADKNAPPEKQPDIDESENAGDSTLQAKYDKAVKEIDTLKAKLANRPEVTEPEPAEGLPSLRGKFKPNPREKKNGNGYYTRQYNGQNLELKSGDDIEVKIKQILTGL